MEKLILQNLTFPLTITPELLKKLVEDNKKGKEAPFMMYS